MAAFHRSNLRPILILLLLKHTKSVLARLAEAFKLMKISLNGNN